MAYSEYDSLSFDGLDLFAREWRPDHAEPQAAICLIHGLGEHGGRYYELAEALTTVGIAVTAFDLRGHGRSGGRRGHTPSFAALLQDIDLALERTARRFPEAPLFLYGHSLGGGLVLNYILRRKPTITGVISTSPWLQLTFQPPALLMRLSKWMNHIFPAFSSSNQLDISGISRDRDIVRGYRKDPLVHDRISARMFLSCNEAGEWALEHAAECTVPVLLMHGTADRITSMEASQQFSERADQTCTFRLWKGFYHEIHHEPQHDEMLSYLISWIGMQLEPQQAEQSQHSKVN